MFAQCDSFGLFQAFEDLSKLMVKVNNVLLSNAYISLAILIYNSIIAVLSKSYLE